MHRFHSKSAILRFKTAAILLCLKWLAIPLTAGVLVDSVVRNDRAQAIVAMGLGGLTVLITLLQRLAASRARCPLCMTPVLTIKRCSKHRNARKFMGSYRLRVALAVLLRGTFMCPYCYEPSAMEVRVRHLRSRAGRS